LTDEVKDGTVVSQMSRDSEEFPIPRFEMDHEVQGLSPATIACCRLIPLIFLECHNDGTDLTRFVDSGVADLDRDDRISSEATKRVMALNLMDQAEYAA
jgi:hypothetical protein